MAGPAVGTQVYFGVSEEVTYGTPVAPADWFEILSESIERRNNILQSNGLRGGGRHARRSSRRVLSSSDAGGPVSMEVATTGMGVWWKHLLGGTPTITQQGATPAYLQEHTIGSLTGKSLTTQVQFRAADGTAVARKTMHGTKILSGEFSIGVDTILTANFELDCEDIDTSTAAAAASYANTDLFHFKQASIEVDSTPVAAVTNANWTITNPLKTDRYYLGSAGLKAEPTDNDFPTVTGTLDAEFLSIATFYDLFAADTAAELVVEFEGAVISGAYNELLRFTFAAVHFTGGTPTVSGPDVVMQSVPWEVAWDGTNPDVKIEYQSTDTSIV